MNPRRRMKVKLQLKVPDIFNFLSASCYAIESLELVYVISFALNGLGRGSSMEIPNEVWKMYAFIIECAFCFTIYGMGPGIFPFLLICSFSSNVCSCY